MFIEREIESCMIKVRKKKFDKNIFKKVDNDFSFVIHEDIDY